MAVSRAGWRELLNDLGYAIEPLRPAGYLAKAAGHPALVVHPHANAFLFARLDEQGRLPEGALIAACRQHGAAYGLLAAGTRVRLLAAGPEEAGATTRYLELDAAALEPDMRPLLGLLSPAYLVDGRFARCWARRATTGRTCAGAWTSCCARTCCPCSAASSAAGRARMARDVADDEVGRSSRLRAVVRLPRALPALRRERRAPADGQPDLRAQVVDADRASARTRSATQPTPRSTAFWDDIASLVKRMRTGDTAWELPAYNGDLFAPDGVRRRGGARARAIADAALGPALVALGDRRRRPGDRLRLLGARDRPPRAHLRRTAVAAALARGPATTATTPRPIATSSRPPARRPSRGRRAAVAHQRRRPQGRRRLLHAHRTRAPPRARRRRARVRAPPRAAVRELAARDPAAAAAQAVRLPRARPGLRQRALPRRGRRRAR